MENGEEERTQSRRRYATYYGKRKNQRRREDYQNMTLDEKEKYLQKKREDYQKNHEKEIKRNQQYRKDNPKKAKLSVKRWREKNKEYFEEYRKKNRKRNRAYVKKYRQSEKGKINQRKSDKKRRQDPMFRLSEAISGQMRQALNGNKKGMPWEGLAGYTLEELKKHLEKQFIKGMTWNNYGKWEIDHRIPKSKFNFKSYDGEGFKKCWDLENLKPMWALENWKKNNKYSEPTLNQVLKQK